jgi:hypothetical protein
MASQCGLISQCGLLLRGLVVAVNPDHGVAGISVWPGVQNLGLVGCAVH